VTGAYASNGPSDSIFARKELESHIINENMILVSLKGSKEQKHINVKGYPYKLQLYMHIYTIGY